MSDETVPRLLEAAIRLFAHRGFAGASTRQIASEAGVNIATINYHFGGKQGLYQATIDRLYELALGLDPTPLSFVEGTAAERLEALVRLLYRFCREHRDHVRLLMRHVLETGTLPAPVRAQWAPALLEKAAALRDVVGLGADPRWKVKLLTLNHLVARYVVTEPEDLLPFLPPEEAADPERAVEDHLVWAAVRLLAPS